MSKFVSVFGLLLLLNLLKYINGFTCIKLSTVDINKRFIIKPRRYDVENMGLTGYYHGWADVQGQGAANDFCRMVGSPKSLVLACALAGTNGNTDRNYISAVGINPGKRDTWYMKDEDGDGRDDYCRCVENVKNNSSQVWCTKAGINGFYGSNNQQGNEMTFAIGGTNNCNNYKVRPEFGKETSFRLP